MSRIIKEHTTVGLDTIVHSISNGTVRIPHFQRYFEWNLKHTAALFRSIFRDIPLGTLVYWQTGNLLQSERFIGGVEIADSPAPYSYVLDGQQRVTSIFCALNGLEALNANGSLLDFKTLYVDLRQNPSVFSLEECVFIAKKDPPDYLFPLYMLYLEEFQDKWIEIEDNEYRRNANRYQQKLSTISFEVEKVTTEDVEVAVDVFRAINMGGKTLTSEAIVSTLLFDAEANWYFHEQTNLLHEQLARKGFSTFTRPNALLRFLSLAHFDKTQDNAMNKLKAAHVIPHWPRFCRSMHLAVDYLKTRYNLKNEKYLFSRNILYLVFYFFYHNGRNPSAEQSREMDRLIFHVGSFSCYAYATTTRLEYDVSQLKTILSGEYLSREDFVINKINDSFSFLEIVENGQLRNSKSGKNSSFYLTILSMRKPKSFHTGFEVVNLSDDYVNVPNQHHVFPKSVYGKPSDNIFNILLLDADTNIQISNRKPADYLKDYEQNPHFKEIMKSHFIEERELEDMRRDDLESFKQHRAENMYRWMNEHLGEEIESREEE